MSLTCIGGSSTYVNVGSPSMYDDLGTLTVIAWAKPSNITITEAFLGKHDGSLAGFDLRIRAGGNFRIFRGRATTNMVHLTTDAPLSNGQWVCVGGVADVTGGAVAAYSGTLAAAMTLRAGTQTVGSGAINTDAAQSMYLGNRGGTTSGFSGDIGPCAIFNRALTVDEMVSWQFNPRVMAGCIGFWMPGDNGTGTQPDLSGNGNNGTVTGATQSDNPPLRRSFGRQILEALYDVVAPAAGGSPYYLHYYNRLVNGVVD